MDNFKFQKIHALGKTVVYEAGGRFFLKSDLKNPLPECMETIKQRGITLPAIVEEEIARREDMRNKVPEFIKGPAADLDANVGQTIGDIFNELNKTSLNEEMLGKKVIGRQKL